MGSSAGYNYSRGGTELYNVGVGPVLRSIRAPHGPNGATVTGGEFSPRGGRSVMTPSTGSSVPSAASGVPGNPLVVLTGLLGLAALLWLARKNSSYLQQNTLGFNTFNVIVIWIVATVGIILAKITFNKIPIPGVTPLVNAV